MKRVILAVLVIVALPGCNWFGGSHPKMAEVWPVYDTPKKPTLNMGNIKPGVSPELDVMIRNLYDTIGYAESLKIIVETHNKAAKVHNQQVEQELGIGQ